MRRGKAFLVAGSISQMPLTGWGELCSQDPAGSALSLSFEVEVFGVNSTYDY
jgi:hypothetical protein